MLMPMDISKVLQHYNLGALENATKAYHGFVNETVFVKTTEGRFVMRRNQRRLSEETHRYRHALVAWLSERGFPCPRFLPTNEGDTLLVLDGRTYEVTPFIDGKDYDPNRPQQLLAVGEILAQYHDAIEGFEPQNEEQTPRYHPQDVMALSERLLERDIMGDLYEELMWYDTRAAKIRAILPDEVYERLPHRVVHGDVHRDNFLFQNDHVIALLDYDQATWDARITDLADAVVGFATDCGPTRIPMQWGVYKGPINIECATDILAAYHAISSLTQAEIAALPLLIELVWLQGEIGRVFSTPEGSPEYHQDVLAQGRWLSEWIAERYDELVERWSHLDQEVNHHVGRFTASAA